MLPEQEINVFVCKSFLILIKAKSFLNVINPLLTKPRDYKLSWPSLFGQDGWILASILFYVFMDQDEVEVHKNAEKELGQNPANTLAELNNSIGGLLHLGPNIITFRTVITLLQ